MTAPDNKTETVSTESIGWLFVKNYYGTYTAEIQNLYAFYDKNASLLHDAFPVEAEESETPAPKTVHLANGTEPIKKHFVEQSSNSEKNKIVIERADFQPSVENSILIVVSGSWKRGSSSLWQFVQTFVLKPVGSKMYDIANDVLKFVDLSESFEEPQVVVQKADTPAPNGKAEPAEAEAQSKPVEQEAVKEKTVEPVEEAIEESKPETEEKEEAKAEEKEAFEEKAEKPAKTAAPAQPSVPAPKPTWANLAAMQPKVPASKTATVASPGAAKNVPPPSPIVKKAASPAQNAVPAPPTLAHSSNSKFKRDEWYPIYIKDADVDEDELRKALTETFGEMKFFKKNQRVVLVDFKEKAYQQKALEAKELLVGNVVIRIEPRTQKHANKKDFKDKKALKKNHPNNGGNAKDN